MISLEDAIQRYSVMRGNFSYFRSYMTIYKDAYFQYHWTSPVGEGDYQATLPLEALVVDTAMAMILANAPLITVVPQGEESDRAEAMADKAERWHLAIDTTNMNMEGTDPKALALFNSLVYGLGWLREVANFPVDWLESEEHDLYPSCAFVQTAPHPGQVHFERGRVPGGIRALAYDADFTVSEIEAEWNVRLKLNQDVKGRFLPKDSFEKRRLVDYWEWVTENRKPVLYHCAFVTSPQQFVKRPVPMDEYKRIPYYPIPCNETAESKPEERYLSFLFKLKEIPHLAEIVVSRELRMAEMYVDPIIVIKRASGQELPFIKAPGAVLELTPEEDARYLQYTGTAPDLPRVRELLLNLMHEASFSPAVLMQGTGDTGMARVADLEQSMFKIGRPVGHFKSAIEQMYWHRTQLANAFSPAKTIPAYGDDSNGRPFAVSMTGKQVARNPKISVRIKTGMYSHLLAEINIATQAVNGKLWRRGTAMDFIGVQDKERETDGIIQDQVELSPQALETEIEKYVQTLRKELGLPPVPGGPPGGDGAMPMGETRLEPSVQGIQNSLQNIATGGAVGAAANPTNPAQIQARRLAQMARGRPLSQPTLGG